MRVIGLDEIKAVSGGNGSGARLPTVPSCVNTFKNAGNLIGGIAGKYAGGIFGADIGAAAGTGVGTLVGNPPAGAIVGAAVGQKYGKQIGSSVGGNLGERAGAYIGGKACGYSMPSLESLEGPIGVDGPCGGGGQATLMRSMMA